MTPRFLSWSRILAVLAKEFIQMRRDRITFAMMLGVPVMQLMLFGYAINTDPKSLPAAIVALSQDRYSRAVVSALETSGYYRFVRTVTSVTEGEGLIESGTVAFVVTIPGDFAARVGRGDRPLILVEADASDPAAASARSASSTGSPPGRWRASSAPRRKATRARTPACRSWSTGSTTRRTSPSTTSCRDCSG